MPQPQQTIAASTLLPLQALLSQRGWQAPQWLGPTGLRSEDLNDPTRRLDEGQLRTVWQQALTLSDDPALGVHAGRVVSPAAFGTLGHVLANADNLGQVLKLLQRFHRLVFDSPLLELHPQASGEVMIALRRDETADPEANRPMVEFLLTALLRLASLLSAGEDLASRYLRAIYLRHGRPAAAVEAAYDQVFGPALRHYQSEFSAIRIDASALQMPVAYRDPQVFALLQQQAQAQLRALSTEADPVQRVRACIRRRLLGQAPNIQDIAADCATSRATLQRRLSAAGSSFRALLEQERERSACELLNEGQRIDDIAHLLGYGDTAAFQHAFKRWTGVSAGAWRTRHTEKTSTADQSQHD